MKLLSIERSIGFFDSKTDKLIQEIILDVSIEQLNIILNADNDDEAFYGFYKLNKAQVSQLSQYTEHLIIPDFDNYFYVLQCFGIYDWDKK